MIIDEKEKLNILSQNFDWFATERDTRDTVKRAPMEKQNFRADNVDNTENFVRELIQNALDANDQSSPKPVSVKIKTVNIKNEHKSLYNNIFSSKIRRFLTDSKDIKKPYLFQIMAQQDLMEIFMILVNYQPKTLQIGLSISIQ